MFGKLFGIKKKEPVEAPQQQAPDQQAMLVYLDATNLPQEIYDEYDVSTLEDTLEGIITEQHLGEFDGNEFGPGEVILFMYGPDAEKLFSATERALREYPLCKNARVVIRKGEPGAVERVVKI